MGFPSGSTGGAICLRTWDVSRKVASGESGVFILISILMLGGDHQVACHHAKDLMQINAPLAEKDVNQGYYHPIEQGTDNSR